MDVQKLNLQETLKYVDRNTPEYESICSPTGSFVLEAYNCYFQVSSKPRLPSDFDRENLTYNTSEPEVFTFKDAIVSRFGILYHGRGPAAPECMNWYGDRIEGHPPELHPPLPVLDNKFLNRIYKMLIKKFDYFPPPVKIKTDKAPILFFDHYFHNFTHFIVEACPRLFWIRKQFPDHPIILPPKPAPGHYDYYQHITPCLEAFGVKREQCIILGNQNYAFKEVILPSHTKMNPECSKQAIEQLKNYFYDPSFKELGERVYISREKCSFRNIAKHEELEALLCGQFGFNKVIMEETSFKDKINIMMRAKYLIASDSSSITNAIFMPENSIVFSLRVQAFPNFNVLLAAAFKLYFIPIICFPVNKEDSWYMGNLKVDLEKMRIILSKFLN